MDTAAKSYYETYWTTAGFKPIGYASSELCDLYSKYLVGRQRILDLGCGDCKTSGTFLRSQGRDYVGVDISNEAVEQAQAEGFHAIAIEDASAVPFDDGDFDAVTCIEVMEHLFSPSDAATEALRVLKPSGLLVVTVPNVAYWRRRAEMLVGRWNPLGDNLSLESPWRDPHIRFFTPISLRRMLQTVGFANVIAGGSGGAFLRDLPWIGHRLSRRSSTVYKWMEKLSPSLLGYRCFAIAQKPEKATTF